MVTIHNFKLNQIGEAEFELEKDYKGATLRFFAEEKLDLAYYYT